MNKKIWSGITAILVTTLLGTTGSTTISSKAYASNSSNTQTDEIAKTRDFEAENNTQLATIYPHQMGDKEAATLYVRSIPILTFLEKPDIATVDPSFRAQQVAQKINQLTDLQREKSDITVTWDEKSKSFFIKLNEDILTTISESTILADTTDDLAEDALQATNRFRRLINDAPPLTEIDGLAKPEVKPQPPLASKPQSQPVAKNRILKTLTGRASWYGPGFHGRATASGQRFNQHGLTAAHRTLPFGTRVRVTNLHNGRSTVVRINDRGPFSGGRIIDLSVGAARAIGMYNSGVANVKLEVLGR